MASLPPNEESKPITTKILEPEVTALKQVLKDTMINTGQVIAFHAETRKLSPETRPRTPPRTLTAALGRNIEKYDQLCDSIEAHLLRAISILKRDLRREEARIEAEEKRKQTEALMLPPPVPVQSTETISDISTALPSGEEGNTNPRNSPVLSGRRPSAISISSLHRPQLPPKLDLSSLSLKMTEEEDGIFNKSLASPVTLAPKSARPTGPNDFPSEFMITLGSDSAPLDSSHSNIDLTLSGDIEPKAGLANLVAAGLGDSSDKPIELDLDGMNIDISQFGAHIQSGNGGNNHDSLFSPMLDNGEGVNNAQVPKDGNPLATFDMDSADHDELFGDFNNDIEESLTTGESMSQPHPNSMPSPGSLMAQFASAQGLLEGKTPTATTPMMTETGESFDINSLDLSLSNFYPGAQDGEMNFAMDMDMGFLNMDSESKTDGNANRTHDPTQS